MKKFLLFLFTCFSLFSTAQQPTLTQTSWETLVDAQLSLTIARANNSADTVIAAAKVCIGMKAIRGKTLAWLEDKMEEFYGPDWKSTGGPVHTACQTYCGVMYAYQWQFGGAGGLAPGCTCGYCTYVRDDTYKDCMRMCGLLPPGL